MSERPLIPLLLPVEVQVRELDAKILFACVAAQRGHPVVIGRFKSLLDRVARFPRGAFVAKSFGSEAFDVVHGAGHAIVGWDEEGLVHYPRDIYFARRVVPDAAHYASDLFAWGPENAALWRSYPAFRACRIHATGNPRLDLLRRDIRPYFESQAMTLREEHGEFILINTNFPFVNSDSELFLDFDSAGEPRTPGGGARGLPLEFAKQLYYHTYALFVRFQNLIPELSRAFPDVRVVVRPHPTENLEVYHRIAAECERVVVAREGNVIPWIMASRAMIHNGCTTGVESNLLDVPTLTYGPSSGAEVHFGRAFLMSNLLSHVCPDFDTLHETLKRILAGELGCAQSVDRQRVFAEFLAPLDGPLVSDRIVDVLSEMACAPPDTPVASLARRWGAWRRRGAPLLLKAFAKRLDRSRRPRGTRRLVHPGISLPEMRERVARFEKILGRGGPLRVEQLDRRVYRIQR